MTTTDVLKLDGRLIPSFKDKQTNKQTNKQNVLLVKHMVCYITNPNEWKHKFLQGGRERRKKNQRDEGGVGLLTL